MGLRCVAVTHKADCLAVLRTKFCLRDGSKSAYLGTGLGCPDFMHDKTAFKRIPRYSRVGHTSFLLSIQPRSTKGEEEYSITPLSLKARISSNGPRRS